MGEVKKYFWDMNMVIWPIFTALVLIGVIVLAVWYLSSYGLIH
ncbi:hypothetical protein MSIBF_A3280003 [groundwater metagenome]|uniref:Uncharacterized protein n=1 Tax=groundwater metagenome TaxID=717931 RepID=A0A098EAW9_9ZZZZ